MVGTKYPKVALPKKLNLLLYYLILTIEKIYPKIPVTADNLDSSFKFRYFDNTKAKNEIEWQPQISLEQCIKDTHQWMIKNEITKK